MNNAEKVHENKLRRWSKKKGLLLQRIKLHNKNDIEYGTYRLINQKTKQVIFAKGGGYSRTSEEIEEFLNNYRPE